MWNESVLKFSSLVLCEDGESKLVLCDRIKVLSSQDVSTCRASHANKLIYIMRLSEE